MFERISNYFRQRFGTNPEDTEAPADDGVNANPRFSDDSPRSRNTPPAGHRPVAISSAQGRVYEQLRSAMTMFTAGYRQETIPFFESTLNNPAADAAVRTVASCLLGEAFRGTGNFGKAQQYYELAIRESDTIPEAMQGLNEFVQHYRPRAFCGLLTVYRRTLFDDHERIKSLIREIKSDFNIFPIEDLPAQVSLMEGLYLRQLGDIQGSLSCISEGLESIRNAAKSSSYFLFLHPEHFEALLLVSHLCAPGNNFHVRKLSREIMQANRGPWSLAFAAAAQLHLHLRQAADGEFSNFSANEFGQENEKVSELIAKLQKNARFEKDPLLLTECAMLSLIWYLLMEDFVPARRELNTLKKILPDCAQPMVLLRAVEIGALRRELELSGLIPDPGVEDILSLGRNALTELAKPLESYGCSDVLLQNWKTLLGGEPAGAGFLLERWASEELIALRCRVWP
ncbi:MAG: hypothetical protein L6Q97_08890 [Thermoanaerobaculia bacterium]|nr:hypothetical protein [Thermoanaerobaculia bacterium]